MRILAVILGTAAAVGLAAAASADPATDRIQLAQAQESGGQASPGMRGGDRQGAPAARKAAERQAAIRAARHPAIPAATAPR
jgi:hypothetical protein